MALLLAALAWGFAEATLFFIVPDVLISYVGLQGLRRAWTVCVFAVAGALIGGLLMFGWGLGDPQGALRAVDRTPAVSGAMLERVDARLREQGPSAMLVGAFTGTPYKTFAVQSAIVGIPVWLFLLFTVPARLLRFALVALLVNGIARVGLREAPSRRGVIALTGFWLVFYALFFSLMPN